MNAWIYIEGGESKEAKIRCREGFRKLFEKSGFQDERMPRLIACGGRNSAFDAFKTAHANKKNSAYIAMLVDSEDPVVDLELTWKHLEVRDRWTKPAGATNEQVLFMTTCMETWIVADRTALKGHYKSNLQATALPALDDLENRNRHDVHRSLEHATRNCKNAYSKGERSFEVLTKLNPTVLKMHLTSFVRIIRILNDKLAYKS